MRLVLASLALCTLLVGGCGDPCDKLLDKVCDCPGIRAKAACSEAKERREARDKEKRNTERCREQLEAFKCAQLN